MDRSTVWGALLAIGLLSGGCSVPLDLGPWFEAGTDVGEIGLSGSTRYEESTGDYLLTGSGANVWGTADAFHFAWARLPGDLSLEAEVTFIDSGGDPHKKAGWMIRAGLEADDPYVDAAVHGDGLIGLQFRRQKGGETEEMQAVTRSPALVRLERADQLYSLSISSPDGSEEVVGALLLDLPPEPLVGLFVTAHNNDRQETARFSRLKRLSRMAQPEETRITESTLEVFDTTTGRRELVYRAADHFEAPNWSRDGQHLLFNQEGRLYRIPLAGGEPAMLETGFADRCNNDHGYSPDGTLIALSHSPERASLIYVIPAEGGEPRLVTEKGPSYWHGWSPDGKTLAYCAEREGEYDIYTIPVSGGKERRLTTAPGLDDGPDYSPDGQFIYLNSERSGLMKIWRISTDGLIQEQVTFDSEFADWFPHPSPDGRHLVFLSYDRSVRGHPPNKEVVLRKMPMEGGNPEILTHFFGGQGSLNVPSWSPDSTRFAFVSYRLVLPGGLSE